MGRSCSRREFLKVATAATFASPVWATAGGPLNGKTVAVENIFGVPTFTINHSPFTSPCFETYVPEKKYYEQFARAGTKVFEFSANSGRSDYRQSSPTWLAPDKWDYSEFDERTRRVLAAAPDGLIFPRVYIGTPEWWLAQYPDEMEILDDGSKTPGAHLYAMPAEARPYPSIASHKWREDMGYGLQHLLEHIQGSDYADHFFGYILAGLKTEEWYHWGSGVQRMFGYSKPAVAAFRRWLQEKYGTVENLRAAWSNPHVDFESAAVPTFEERHGETHTTFRDPARHMNVIDFYCFYNELIPETIGYFAGVVKRVTEGRKVVGAFYAYMYEFNGDPEFGHNALAKLNASPHLDCVAVTASYGDRFLATGGDYQRAPALSVALHGKLWYHDNDVISYRAREVMGRVYKDKKQLEIDLDRLAATKNPTESRWMYRRGVGFALCNGMYEAFFDLHGGYFDSPELMEEIAILNRLWERARKFDRSSVSEILIVSDEPSCSYCAFKSSMLAQSLLQTQWELIKIGAPADHILIDDLELVSLDRHKLVVFLNTYNLTDRQRDLIEKKVKNAGRTLLWCYAPGLFNETRTSSELMQELTGMQIVVSRDETFIAPQIEIRELSLPLAAAWRKAGLRVLGPDKPICKLISVEDREAIALGTLPGASAVTLAFKKQRGWSSVYAVSATLPAAFYRELARSAGVHIYNDHNDTFYANRSYVTVHANGAGPRTVRFPSVVELWDAVTEKLLMSRARSFTYDFQHGETLILRWG